MLTGDNGILTKAQSSKNKNDETSVEEKIKLAVMYSRMNTNGDTKINLDELENELNKNFNNDVNIDKKGENGKLPWYVTSNGYMFEIKEDGTVEKTSGIILDRTRIEVLQGSEPQTLKATLQGVVGKVTWESSDTDVVTVNNGTVTFNNPGTATIKARLGEEYETLCEVFVLLSAKDIVSIPNSIDIKEGEIKDFEITCPQNVENFKYDFSESDILSISENRKISTASNLNANKTVTVTVKGVLSNEIIGICTVNVSVDTTPPVWKNVSLVNDSEKIDGFTLNMEAEDSETGVEKFEVYNSENDVLISSTTNVNIEDGIYKSTLNVTGLNMGTKYNVYVKAIDKKGNVSINSQIISAETINPNVLKYPILTSKGIMNCKNETGYYYDKDINCKSDDALNLLAYDRNDDTHFQSPTVDWYDQRLNVDAEMLGKNITLIVGYWTQNNVLMDVVFINNNDEEVADPNYMNRYYYNFDITIPNDCKQIIFRFQGNAWINEIHLST